MQSIPQKFHDLLADETKAFAFLSTVMKDGTPQVTPVWFDTEDEYILVNSARGRVKDRNMRARPDVALAIMDFSDPYRYLQIRGKVVEVTEIGASDHIDKLAKKYLGKERYPNHSSEEVRVIYKISPEEVSAK